MEPTAPFLPTATQLHLESAGRHVGVRVNRGPLPNHNSLPPSTGTWAQDTPLSLDEAEADNPHIIGPDMTNDNKVLADYLSTVNQNTGIMRLIRPPPGTHSGPVIFTKVQKRALGVSLNSTLAASKLQVIEKLLEPWGLRLIQLYFAKVNPCFPLLDEVSFMNQFMNTKERISPALLACLYAYTLTFWRYDSELSQHFCPDSRFTWNLASEALHSELHLSPGISTITALLLNIGGRPTSSMIGNGILIGSAVSLSHSLGLNRNPLNWDIPESEKYLRMKIWWSLLVHDGWSSLAYGTPPHIRKSQYDVPAPKLEYLNGHASRDCDIAKVFIALVRLTEVLYQYLEQIYTVDKTRDSIHHNIECDLDDWVENLDGRCRRIIIRGTELDIPGAANLRLAYLSTRLLTSRIQLNSDKEALNADPVWIRNRYIQVRRTAEEIMLFTQELLEEQLDDFWLPVAAFTFSSTVTFLLRCALEIDDDSTGLTRSSSLKMARDLLASLRQHREKFSWDLADIALAQHTEVVEKLMAAPTVTPAGASTGVNVWPTFVPNTSVIDSLFPSIWDMMQTI
ncbi:fungal-specific transcription factor domain-containing protein [Whalleya microplaca]|nr:fungal-specific transcription factor domain-containing protein [Whalleya microplaca]